MAMNLNEDSRQSGLSFRPIGKKAVLASVVFLSTIIAVLAWWLYLANPIVWTYFLLLIGVGVYLIKSTTRSRSSLIGLFFGLSGLAVLAFGVSFSNVVAMAPAAPLQPWGVPPGAGIRLGDGFTLEFVTEGYTYYVNTPGVLAGYLLFFVGVGRIEFVDA